jgi:hypothetical protein
MPDYSLAQVFFQSRPRLWRKIARGRQWLSEVEAGAATIEGIAAREACSRRHIHMTISLMLTGRIFDDRGTA